jgi:hypothetical protein
MLLWEKLAYVLERHVVLNGSAEFQRRSLWRAMALKCSALVPQRSLQRLVLPW